MPLPGTDVRIVDEEGRDVPEGEAGELIVKGPQVMAGYWQRPDETARVIRDGWLYTGDVAQMDDEGYVFIVDRKKDMILVSGFNVYPNEVEAVIAAHPGVQDCAVDRRPRRGHGRMGGGLRHPQGSRRHRGDDSRSLPRVAHRLQGAEAGASSATSCRSRRSARCCARTCGRKRWRRNRHRLGAWGLRLASGPIDD